MADDKLSQFAEFELEMLKTWEKEKTFAKSLEQRQEKPRFSFYDGPPFPSGEPHYGHVEQTAVKDAVVRYKTMRGFFTSRRTGYDTHGLPIEVLVEKELGLKSKQDIVKLGIEKFNAACRAVVFRHRDDFESMYRRIGRWANPEEAYATLDNNYIESVWWVFKQLHDKKLIYKSFKSVPYCPRCATPLSNFEVNDGYKENVKDPSLYVKFQLKDRNESLLAWTTTPWSLPGNAALAVHPNESYATVEVKNDAGKIEKLILAEKRLEILDAEFKILKKQKGEELAGQSYQPLFELPGERVADSQKLYTVIAEPIVDIEDGTGVLHVAPSFGEVDLELGQNHKLAVLHSVDENGLMRSDIGLPLVAGKFFKFADEEIIATLAKRGMVYAVDASFTHTYPFCWRCETPLLYYAIDTWFMDISTIKKDLLKTGKQTSWEPGNAKQGRFLNWLEGARDWAISRNRFWGAPMPIWVNQNDAEDILVVGSVDELEELSGTKKLEDLHRPFIDQVVIKKDGKTYKRIAEVFDVWFESGSMPYAQDHYPFENKGKFREAFPADFVVEAVEQVHLWFYTLHVHATALFTKPAFKTALADGLILAADGRKLSKRLKNYPPIETLLDNFGADTTRFFILSSPLMDGVDARLDEKVFRDIYRNVFMTLWNTFTFFRTYTEVDKWQPPAALTEPKSAHVLDRWILDRLNEVTSEATERADKYQIGRATRPLAGLVDDLSNWYVRRSRRRFWKSEDDKDKQEAYATLHYVLVRTCQLMAPWAPFLCDKIYRELRSKDMPESVHLTDWPEAGKVDESLIEQMQLARDFITEGLKQRADAGIKVRQPLSKAAIPELGNKGLAELVKDELNVKEIKWVKWGNNPKEALRLVKVDARIPHELKLEGLAREVIRHIQQYRKELNLNVDDRIKLELQTADGELKQAIQAFGDLISAETLAKQVTFEMGDTAKPVDIDGNKLEMSITKTKT